MAFDFVETKTLLLVVHLIGLALGVGGAFISDAMFFKSVQDWRITKTEMEFLTLGSYAVGAGLVTLIISGLGLFSLNPEAYLASSKFLAKMTIVGILILNGILLHNLQIPYLKHVSRKGTSTRTSFAQNRLLFLFGGAVSIISWVSALILGIFRTIPLPYEHIMSVYFLILISGYAVAYLLRDHLMPTVRAKP